MGAGEVGYIFGSFLITILLPALILIVCNFVPSAKHRPKLVYGVCGVLAIVVCLISASGGGRRYGDAVVAAGSALAFLYWGYVRAAKRAKAPVIS